MTTIEAKTYAPRQDRDKVPPHMIHWSTVMEALYANPRNPTDNPFVRNGLEVEVVGRFIGYILEQRMARQEPDWSDPNTITDAVKGIFPDGPTPEEIAQTHVYGVVAGRVINILDLRASE